MTIVCDLHTRDLQLRTGQQDDFLLAEDAVRISDVGTRNALNYHVNGSLPKLGVAVGALRGGGEGLQSDSLTGCILRQEFAVIRKAGKVHVAVGGAFESGEFLQRRLYTSNYSVVALTETAAQHSLIHQAKGCIYIACQTFGFLLLQTILGVGFGLSSPTFRRKLTGDTCLFTSSSVNGGPVLAEFRIGDVEHRVTAGLLDLTGVIKQRVDLLTGQLLALLGLLDVAVELLSGEHALRGGQLLVGTDIVVIRTVDLLLAYGLVALLDLLLQGLTELLTGQQRGFTTHRSLGLRDVLSGGFLYLSLHTHRGAGIYLFNAGHSVGSPGHVHQLIVVRHPLRELNTCQLGENRTVLGVGQVQGLHTIQTDLLTVDELLDDLSLGLGSLGLHAQLQISGGAGVQHSRGLGNHRLTEVGSLGLLDGLLCTLIIVDGRGTVNTGNSGVLVCGGDFGRSVHANFSGATDSAQNRADCGLIQSVGQIELSVLIVSRPLQHRLDNGFEHLFAALGQRR